MSHFESVNDPRSSRNQKHRLDTLIGTSLLAALAGIDSFSGIEEFVEVNLEELSEYFEFPHGVPSHDTYRKLWDTINPEEFYLSFESFTQTLKNLDSHLINVDGKAIRNSGQEKMLHIVSAWCPQNQLTLAQEKVDCKSNEITAIPKLLKKLDLQNKIVTIDAMGTQRDICAQIVEQGADYVISLKGNQGTLHQDVQEYFREPDRCKDYLCFEEYDKGHGRIEKRTALSLDEIEWLQSYHQWPGLRSIGRVISTVTRKGKTTEETRFYISSLPADAEQLNKTARAHWGIENQLHWRLDVVFNEDKACIRNDNAAENMDILRKWALNALQKVKSKPEQSIKSIMRKNSMSLKHLLASVKKIFHA